MTVYLQDTDLTLHRGDCLEVLRTLPDRSVHMCATSPPFFGLRDYQVEGQIGLEETPDQWVERLVAVFREVRRVLRDDGTLWVEIGDSYTSSGNGGDTKSGFNARYFGTEDRPQKQNDPAGLLQHKRPGKPKDLLGQPWLLAFALRADGWYLRSEIIWARPNPMPESVTDRPTKSHSTVFLMSKRPRYFYDADAIREAFSPNTHSRGNGTSPKMDAKAASGHGHEGWGATTRWSPADDARHDRLNPQSETLDGSEGEAPRGPDGRRVTAVVGGNGSEQHRDGERWPNPTGANARSVWQIPTEPTPFAHFATWPRKLVARMILAGTSERGCCPECGAPWVRDVERVTTKEGEAYDSRMERWGEDFTPAHQGGRSFQVPIRYNLSQSESRTLGWSPSCAHDHEPVPCTVLDPFAGSGTTLLVARQHGRHSIGIELNPAYCELVRDRTSQQSLLANAQ